MADYIRTGMKMEGPIDFIPETIYICREHPGDDMTLREFVKLERKKFGLNQDEAARKAGVGLRFLRDLEQGKATLRMDKVNQLLELFGAELGVVPMRRE